MASAGCWRAEGFEVDQGWFVGSRLDFGDMVVEPFERFGGGLFNVGEVGAEFAKFGEEGFGVGSVAVEVVEAFATPVSFAPSIGFDRIDAEVHAFSDAKAREQVDTGEADSVREHFVAGGHVFDGGQNVRQHFGEVMIGEVLESACGGASGDAVFVFKEGLEGGVELGSVDAVEGFLKDAVRSADAWVGLEKGEAGGECCMASGIGGV